MFKRFFEETNAGDIAQATPAMGLHKKCTGKDDCECDKCQKLHVNESPVGMVGRTGYKDAEAHVTPELRARFKKIVKELGGKTVARKLLSEMNGQVSESLSSSTRDEFASIVSYVQSNCSSKRMRDALDEVLDLLDTDC